MLTLVLFVHGISVLIAWLYSPVKLRPGGKCARGRGDCVTTPLLRHNLCGLCRTNRSVTGWFPFSLLCEAATCDEKSPTILPSLIDQTPRVIVYLAIQFSIPRLCLPNDAPQILFRFFIRCRAHSILVQYAGCQDSLLNSHSLSPE